MADDRDDAQRTEEPTQRRLEQAQEQGDVVKSTEVSVFVTLVGATLAIAIFSASTAAGFANFFRVFLEQPDQIAVDAGGIMVLLHGILWKCAGLLAPVFAVLIGAALAGHLLQHRPVFSTERLKPSLSKLSLFKGLKRMFGLEGLSNLAKGVLKIAIVAAAVWTVLWPMRGGLEGILTESPMAVASDMTSLVMRILIAALAVLAVVAVLDYLLQRYRFLQRNRMSRQEVKEEFRQSEGDPAIRAKIKQIRAEKSRRRMMAAVPGATVVITNPTHFAVALKYEAGKMAAPVCVAKGMDALALRIREVAEDSEVPVVENPPLARALYASVEIDEAVPPEHFKAVAQVIGYVMRLTGQMRAN
ncbi:MAG TPA: flagellar biosynthesis protein FlhB [Rhizomicrobium sp.]|nr:flagellar biosynthesis protein FlhB [Rhizomicrobium sp.]